MEPVIIQTKDPTFASRCRKHNIHYMVDTDESGYDVYLLDGSYKNIMSLLDEINGYAESYEKGDE